MDEKKLTDEEIVKALECDNDEQTIENAIDLIHRLQSGIAEYERKITDGEFVSKEWHDEQVLHDKEEIERLQSENAELQKQVEELTTEKSDGFLFFSQRMKLGEICEAYFREHRILNCAQSVIGHLMRLGLLNVPKAKQYLKEQNNEKKK